MQTQDSSITHSTATAPLTPSIMEAEQKSEAIAVPVVEEGSKDVDNLDKKRPRPPQNDNRKQKKPKAVKPDLYKIAYENVSFIPISSTGRPGTPHALFQESYTVHWKNGGSDDDNDTPEQQQLPQIVHKHANGLVIVTAGNRFTTGAAETTATATLLDSVNFMIEEAPKLNAGERRKIQSKMMHNKKVTQGVVQPSSVLCRAVTAAADEPKKDTETTANDTKDEDAVTGVPLYSCVWGAVIEINLRLLPAREVETDKPNHNAEAAAEPNLLAQDPLLDGYLAIILPTGPFPPKE